jgi:hypothetical protein
VRRSLQPAHDFLCRNCHTWSAASEPLIVCTTMWYTAQEHCCFEACHIEGRTPCTSKHSTNWFLLCAPVHAAMCPAPVGCCSQQVTVSVCIIQPGASWLRPLFKPHHLHMHVSLVSIAESPPCPVSTAHHNTSYCHQPAMGRPCTQADQPLDAFTDCKSLSCAPMLPNGRPNMCDTCLYTDSSAAALSSVELKQSLHACCVDCACCVLLTWWPSFTSSRMLTSPAAPAPMTAYEHIHDRRLTLVAVCSCHVADGCTRLGLEVVRQKCSSLPYHFPAFRSSSS